MKLRYLVPLAAVGFGIAACGSQTAQLQVTPLANVSSASGSGTAAGGSAAPSSAAACDAGAWRTNDISVEGKPDGFDAGDGGATYVWHDSDGWHLRTTDKTASPHVYSGRMVLSSGHFLDVNGIRLEDQDEFRVVGDTLYYRFVTYDGIDGLDFRVAGCSPAEHQALTFHLRHDGSLDAARVIVGDAGRHPESDPFTAVRSI